MQSLINPDHFTPAVLIAVTEFFSLDPRRSLGDLLTALSSLLFPMCGSCDEMRRILALTMQVNLKEADGVIPVRADLLLARDLFEEIAKLAGINVEDSLAVLDVVNELIARQSMANVAQIAAH